MKVNGMPSIKTLTSALVDEWRSMRQGCKDDYRDMDGGHCLDVRLRVHNGGWELLTGSADYDQDHRGYWGASCIPWERTRLEGIARDLIEQVKDMATA